MTPTNGTRCRALSRCRGYAVVASDGPVGRVESALFPPDDDEPDYLIVRTRGMVWRRHPVVASALVQEVDAGRQVVYVRGCGEQIRRLPEYLPLAI